VSIEGLLNLENFKNKFRTEIDNSFKNNGSYLHSFENNNDSLALNSQSKLNSSNFKS
jgi:hypothetical protein